MIDSSTKACRWLGWLQCLLAYEGLAGLQESKAANLASGQMVSQNEIDHMTAHDV